MPNFTKGEWFVAHEGKYKIASITRYIGIYADCEPSQETIESDARLVAQSKKMYEVIKEALQDYESNDIPECMDFCWPDKMKAILSEIDKE